MYIEKVCCYVVMSIDFELVMCMFLIWYREVLFVFDLLFVIDSLFLLGVVILNIF